MLIYSLCFSYRSLSITSHIYVSQGLHNGCCLCLRDSASKISMWQTSSFLQELAHISGVYLDFLTITCIPLLCHIQFLYATLLKSGGEGDNKERDGWMASLTRWTWVWASSGSWWWTEQSGVLQSIGLQRVRYDWVTELNWTDAILLYT